MSQRGEGYRDLPYRGRGGGGGGGGGGERWDSERFAVERDRARFTAGRGGGEFEERDSRFASKVSFGGQARDRSADDGYERRGPQRYEDDRYERRTYYDDEPRMEPERRMGRDRGQSITIEKERVREYTPSPPRRGPSGRPAFLRRQSSLDTFDRKPLTRFAPPTREEYGPPARYVPDVRPVMTPIPLPRSRGLGPPPRRYGERDYYDEIEIAEPDLYGDDAYRGAPERIREREVIRRRRRSKSGESRAESRRSHSKRGASHRGSVRSESVSSESSASSTEVSVRSEFPKKGKTRMPARLVSKKAIEDLGYPFEEEGETIIILKALGRENIDEVIKLSEDYKSNETNDHVHETTLTTYLVAPEPQMSGARSEAGTIIEEKHEVYTIPPPPTIVHAPPPPPTVVFAPPPPAPVEIVHDTKIVEHHHAPHYERPIPGHGYAGAVIHDAVPREEYVERRRSFVEHAPMGAIALAPQHHHLKNERSIRAEIKALEAEKEALKAEKRAEHEMRKADRIRRGGGRHSETDLVLYEQDTYRQGEEYTTVIRKERIEREDDGGVKIQKDKKGRMSISVPKYYR